MLKQTSYKLLLYSKDLVSNTVKKQPFQKHKFYSFLPTPFPSECLLTEISHYNLCCIKIVVILLDISIPLFEIPIYQNSVHNIALEGEGIKLKWTLNIIRPRKTDNFTGKVKALFLTALSDITSRLSPYSYQNWASTSPFPILL